MKTPTEIIHVDFRPEIQRMKINFPFFCYAKWDHSKEKETSKCTSHLGSGLWFRIFWGYGLHFTNGRMLFSERNGYEKRLHLPFGWRVKIIKPSRG